MIKKSILILILISSFSFAATVKQIVLDFNNRSNHAVYVDKKYYFEDIVLNDEYFITNDIKTLQSLFISAFKSSGFQVDLVGEDIYISRDVLSSTDNNNTVILNQKQYTYNLKYVTFDDLQSVISSFPSVSVKYLKSYNQIIFSCNEDKYKDIRNMILSVDVPIRSKNIKITVFNSSDDVSSDIGIKINKLGFKLENSTFQSFDFYNNLLEFDAYISALKNNNKISISQSPTFFLINGNKLSFKSVKNIPYITQTSEVQNTGTSTTSSYSYKDVGLQIELTPRISKKSTLLELNLKIEDLIDLNLDKPLTNRLEYTNTIVMNNVPVLLTGLKKTINANNVISIPLLGDLPYIGNMFKFKSNKNETSNMSILIEFIPNIKDF
ncbi:MAG: type II secretion system protein GspD [Sulfurovaceae bacterium]